MVKNKLLILFIIKIFYIKYIYGLTNCFNPSYKSCSFYSDCLENKYHCGHDGYPLGYGNKFCEIFKDSSYDFTKEGQDWIWNTMHCLQEELIPLYKNTSNCTYLEKFAFNTHSECYVKTGFCNLDIKDKYILIEIIISNKINNIFGNFLKQAIQTIDLCVENIIK